MRKPTVFICSSVEGLAIAQQFALQLEPSVIPALWSERFFDLGKTVTESLTEAADHADFAIFVLTNDDIVGNRVRHSEILRQNVAFEMGFLAGRIGLSRIFVILDDPGPMPIPSDLTGVMLLKLSPSAEPDRRTSVAHVIAPINRAIAELGLRPERRSELPSCFISYSWRDKDFAARLYGDLKQVGVRSWLDAKELKVGDSISEQISRAMPAHDKVLLVLSRSSVRSSWVDLEIQKAFDLESARESTVLFPLRLDDAVFAVADKPEFDRLRDRLILDFSNWQNGAQYRKAFSRLVRDLAINASVESERR